jgi:hypothetical protein
MFEKSSTGNRSWSRDANNINTGKLYDADLTDAAWALIAPMLPAARPVADHARPTFALC